MKVINKIIASITMSLCFSPFLIITILVMTNGNKVAFVAFPVMLIAFYIFNPLEEK